MELKGISMVGVNFEGFNLRRVNLCGTDLRYANLKNSDLSFCNIQHTDFDHANLDGALLFGAYGENRRIKTLHLFPYSIVILDKSIVYAGCVIKSCKEWLEFDGKLLPDWQQKYLETVTKPFIRMVLEMKS